MIRYGVHTASFINGLFISAEIVIKNWPAKNVQSVFF